jgi:hypothetical protein
MSNRERWIVYPLLVWALGMGFRSQYEWLFERSSLECREVRIVDEQGKTRLRLAADNLDGGRVALVDAEGAAAMVLQEKKGLVTLKPEKGDEIPLKTPK